jgi:uracil-DNA glycosylase
LTAVGMHRADLYISNVVKFRPSRVSNAGRQVNRPPTRAEIALFTPWLMREVSIIRPCALVTLGNVALNAFLEERAVIGDHHGRWQDVRIAGEGFSPFTVPLFALYHPASVIYNRSLADVYRDDIALLAATRTRSGTVSDG